MKVRFHRRSFRTRKERRQAKASSDDESDLKIARFLKRAFGAPVRALFGSKPLKGLLQFAGLIVGGPAGMALSVGAGVFGKGSGGIVGKIAPYLSLATGGKGLFSKAGQGGKFGDMLRNLRTRIPGGTGGILEKGAKSSSLEDQFRPDLADLTANFEGRLGDTPGLEEIPSSMAPVPEWDHSLKEMPSAPSSPINYEGILKSPEPSAGLQPAYHPPVPTIGTARIGGAYAGAPQGLVSKSRPNQLVSLAKLDQESQPFQHIRPKLHSSPTLKTLVSRQREGKGILATDSKPGPGVPTGPGDSVISQQDWDALPVWDRIVHGVTHSPEGQEHFKWREILADAIPGILQSAPQTVPRLIELLTAWKAGNLADSVVRQNIEAASSIVNLGTSLIRKGDEIRPSIVNKYNEEGYSGDIFNFGGLAQEHVSAATMPKPSKDFQPSNWLSTNLDPAAAPFSGQLVIPSSNV